MNPLFCKCFKCFMSVGADILAPKSVRVSCNLLNRYSALVTIKREKIRSQYSSKAFSIQINVLYHLV